MPFYTQPVFTKNQSARALGIFAAPGHFAASHPRLLADYEDGRVVGGGSTAASQRAERFGGTVVLDGGIYKFDFGYFLRFMMISCSYLLFCFVYIYKCK